MIERIKYWMIKIIPSIHNLPQVIYIRWMDRDWYIRKETIKHNFNNYLLLDVILLMLLGLIAGVFPMRTTDDFLTLLVIAVINGIQSGIAVVKDRENNR